MDMMASGVHRRAAGGIFGPALPFQEKTGLSDELYLVRLLNRLVRTPLSGLDEAVTDIIGASCAEIGADCGCLFRLSGKTLVATHQFTSPGKKQPTLDAAALFKACRQRFEAGETVRSPMPDSDKSFLAMPIHGPDGLSGPGM